MTRPSAEKSFDLETNLIGPTSAGAVLSESTSSTLYMNQEAWNSATAAAASPMGASLMMPTIRDIPRQQTPPSWISLPDLSQANSATMDSLSTPLNEAGLLKCSWAGCPSTQIFNRKSDFTKHMDKHTRPYPCPNPQCNGLSFGDKAGLRRHVGETHDAAKFCCVVRSCPRYTRGFGRKRNLELHIVSRHRSGVKMLTARTVDAGAEWNVDSTEDVEMGAVDKDEDEGKGGDGVMRVDGGMDSLTMTLRELEKKKKELVESQVEVDADILAVRRAMTLVLN